MCQEAAVNHMQGLPMITVIQQSLLGHYKARQQVKTANLAPAIKGTEGKGTIINGPLTPTSSVFVVQVTGFEKDGSSSDAFGVKLMWNFCKMKVPPEMDFI